MHYHLLDKSKIAVRQPNRLIGLVFLAVFLALVGKVWVPYAQAITHATAIKILPPAWADQYIEATLPARHKIDTANRLVIRNSDLSINAPIVTGVSSEELLRGVGWDPQSAKPGQQGRVVISGHRFWPSNSPWATVFFSLDKLKIGDAIDLRYEGREYRYIVKESWNVPKQKAHPYLSPTTTPILTIYTCGPTPYSAKNRLGFTAILDQAQQPQESGKVIDALQTGIF